MVLHLSNVIYRSRSQCQFKIHLREYNHSFRSCGLISDTWDLKMWQIPYKDIWHNKSLFHSRISTYKRILNSCLYKKCTHCRGLCLSWNWVGGIILGQCSALCPSHESSVLRCWGKQTSKWIQQFSRQSCCLDPFGKRLSRSQQLSCVIAVSCSGAKS